MDTALVILGITLAAIPGFVMGRAFENQSIAVGDRILRLLRIIKS